MGYKKKYVFQTWHDSCTHELSASVFTCIRPVHNQTCQCCVWIGQEFMKPQHSLKDYWQLMVPGKRVSFSSWVQPHVLAPVNSLLFMFMQADLIKLSGSHAQKHKSRRGMFRGKKVWIAVGRIVVGSREVIMLKKILYMHENVTMKPMNL